MKLLITPLGAVSGNDALIKKKVYHKSKFGQNTKYSSKLFGENRNFGAKHKIVLYLVFSFSVSDKLRRISRQLLVYIVGDVNWKVGQNGGDCWGNCGSKGPGSAGYD